MMRSLAERAPMLFRKNVISVDILTESEEEVLDAVTGVCGPCVARPVRPAAAACIMMMRALGALLDVLRRCGRVCVCARDPQAASRSLAASRSSGWGTRR